MSLSKKQTQTVPFETEQEGRESLQWGRCSECKFWFPQIWRKGVPMGVGMDGVRQGIIQVDGWMVGWLVLVLWHLRTQTSVRSCLK